METCFGLPRRDDDKAAVGLVPIARGKCGAETCGVFGTVSTKQCHFQIFSHFNFFNFD